MSKLSDYSKFDHLVDSDDDDADGAVPPNPSQSAHHDTNNPSVVPHQPQQQTSPVTSYHQKDPATGRYVFYHGSQKVYEWEQTLDTVTMYVDVPPYQNDHHGSTPTKPTPTTAKDLLVRITPKQLQVGLHRHPNQFFLNHDLYSLVDTTESCWFLEDNTVGGGGTRVLQIVLQKQRRGETWDCVLLEPKTDRSAGGTGDASSDAAVATSPLINPLLKQEMQQQLLLERFQEENTGMDFRDATFNGSVPDPRTYMGGIGYE
jgi:CS domain